MENTPNQETQTQNNNTGSNPSMDPKTIAIVAYITIIGWIVAIIMNNPKNEHASFHIRQFLGIALLGFASGFVMIVPVLGWIAGLVGYLAAFVFWIIGLISAVQGTQKEVPVVGKQFQQWFSSL